MRGACEYLISPEGNAKAWPKNPDGFARHFTYNNHKKKLPSRVANFAAAAAAVVYAS